MRFLPAARGKRTGGASVIRVLLADDHYIVRAGLRRIIEEADDISVVAEASDGREAVRMARETEPDVAIIDISMPDVDGLEVINQVACHLPKLAVIMLTMYEEEQYVVRAIGAGAKGYITKRSAPEQLVNAIRKVHDGGRYLTDSAAEALALHMAKGDSRRSLVDALSTRELQVLRCLALGQTTREIAQFYNVSTKTVDTYRLRLLKKLNLRNNAELSRFAVQNKLIEI
jgi:DNA-binding NarL/FixJ family response regulator